ncbi:UDP-N-acetylmuramoyl-L-alanyl-D-glutamate--2,6-diaminopimelate ligase [Spongisporangium articulatum]|uniref:UDP-N-acetylmuramoyl-L-alanyl-D-glutamate--2,6-diaminopimelate ligase n=1 Tax=Spongisporangium articulatum TaxID=3362603 RepID=A0ABW8ATV0_9ACTN
MHPSNARTVADLATLLGVPAPPGADVPLFGVTLDSRRVTAGDLYAALPGAATHGARFGAQAADAGAVAVLTDPEGERLLGEAGVRLPALVVPDPRAVLGRVSATVYRDPATKLTMYGITGTNGKTTTAHLLHTALNGGQKAGLIGTVGVLVGDDPVPSARTTPEAPDVQRLLATMYTHALDSCVMEVSSHALVLGRVDGIVFDVVGFTNLSQDHLDFHPTMEDYFAAKATLFTPERAQRGVVCVDDEWGRRLAAEARVPVTTLTTDPVLDADWRAVDIQPEGERTRFTLVAPDGREVEAVVPLPGDFNVANMALALVMGDLTGHELGVAATSIFSRGRVPGRMEPVTSARPEIERWGYADRWQPYRGEPTAVVDYAHTPDAVAKALEALAPGARGPLVVVLGAGGDRDRGKRPGMGAAAAAHADVVIVTDDNPRSEDPAAIRAAVLAGARQLPAPRASVVLEIGDRAAAILEGVRRAWGGSGPPGTLLVAGKGHESGQEVAGAVHPFDDRSQLGEALVAVGTEVGTVTGGAPRRGAGQQEARE